MQTPKFGNKPKLTVLVFESPDLDNVIRTGRLGTDTARGSLAEWVREKYEGKFEIDLHFTPAFRADILAQQLSNLEYPEELAEYPGPSEKWRSQFENPLTGLEADIVILSILPNIRQHAWRHRTAGCLLMATEADFSSMTSAESAWFAENFEAAGRIGKAGFQESFRKVVRHFKNDLDVHIIVFGCSSIDIDDPTHNYHGLPETLAYRAALFNSEAIRFSFTEGISIVDVDRVVAEIPGENKVPAAFTYSDKVNMAVSRELFRIVEDIGFFEDRPLLVQAGQGKD